MVYRRRPLARRPRRGRRTVRPVARRLRRALGKGQPTFVETYNKALDNLSIPVGTGLGKYFDVKITDIPQIADYADLYTQYRINWVKVMLLPNFNGMSADGNSAAYNNSLGATGPASVGMARIVYAVQDSPDQQTPASELEVLQDNGCKIKSIGSKWSCSFKPVPNIQQGVTGMSTTIAVKNNRNSWFNIDTVTKGNNPDHGGVKVYITVPGGDPAHTGFAMSYICYYKVSFTLRDPQ